MATQRTRWLQVLKPISPRARLVIGCLSFIVPILLWSIVSYVPFVWHPQMLITNPGSVDYLQPGMRMSKGAFADAVKEARNEEKEPPEGLPANPIYLPAPHEVARAFYTSFTTPPPSQGGRWLHQSLWHSIQIIFWGFVVASAIGVPLGILCGTYAVFSRLNEPFIGAGPAKATRGLASPLHRRGNQLAARAPHGQQVHGGRSRAGAGADLAIDCRRDDLATRRHFGADASGRGTYPAAASVHRQGQAGACEGVMGGMMTLVASDTLPGGKHWSMVLWRNNRLRLTDVEGGANIGMLFYKPFNLLERYNAPDTLKCQHTFKLTEGHCLYSDMGRIFCSIVTDTSGWHDTVCGNTTKASVAKKWGETSYQEQRNDWYQNGHDSFLVEAAKYGLGRRDLAANVNWFSRVVVADDGALSLDGSAAKAGASVELRFEMDTLVLFHTCPHPLSTAVSFPRKSVRYEIFEGKAAGADDPNRLSAPENGRGFENSRIYRVDCSAQGQR